MEEENEKGRQTVSYYQDIVDRAHKEIEGVRSVYKWLATLIVLLMAVGIGFAYKSVGEFRAEIREDLKELKREVEKRVDEELSKETIQNLITNKVSERVDLTADKIIENQIQAKVEPKIKDAETRLNTIDEKLEEVERIGTELKLKSEVIMTIIAAQNDDREAFDKLSSWSKDPTFQFSNLADNAVVKIRTSYGRIFTPGYLNVSWKEGTDPSQLPLSKLRKLYMSIAPQYHAYLVNYIWGRDDFPKKDRMQFLVDVLNKAKSLTATYYAGKFLAEEANIKWSPFVIKPLIKWWEKNNEAIE